MPKFTALSEDGEIRNIYTVFSATRLRDMTGSLNYQMQPILDFLLRKVFWLFLFGHEELYARGTSLIYGLLTTAFVYFSTYYWLSTQKKFQKFEVFLIAAGLGLWVSNIPTLIKYSVYARSYSLVGLISFIWFYRVLFMQDTRSKFYKAISLAFANAHFFVFPLLATSTLKNCIENYKKNQLASIFKELAFFAFCILFTVLLNLPAFQVLLNGTPSPNHAGFFSSVGQGLLHLLELFKSLNFSTTIFFILFVLFFSEKSKLRSLSFYIAIGILPFFIYAKSKSTYSMGDRHFTPFMGIGQAILIFSYCGLKTLITNKTTLKEKLITLILSVLFIFTCGGFHAVTTIISKTNQLKMPPRNFTQYYKIYDEIKREQVPVFIIHNYCFAPEIPNLYMRYIEPPYMHGYDVADLMGCDGISPKQLFTRMELFIKNNPKGIFVFDNSQYKCPKDKAPYATPKNGFLKRLEGTNFCEWKYHQAKRAKDVIDVAEKLNFEMNPELKTL